MSWYDIDPNDKDGLYRNWEEQNAAKTGAAAPGFDVWGMPLPAAPAPAAATTPPAGVSAADKSARAAIEAGLAPFGLGHLGDRLWQQFKDGTPIEQIFLDLRKTPEYATRFPGMAELGKNGRAISEQQYISLESSYAEAARRAGLPKSFYDDPTDFGKLIGNDVSPAEFQARVDMAADAAAKADPTVRNELQRLYGVSEGELTAFFIDPDRALPLVEKRYRSAGVGASAIRSGYGALTADEAESVSDVLSADQAVEGFGTLAANQGLFESNLGSEEAISRADQIGAITGSNPARQRIERKKARRLAEFDGGGQFASSNAGIAGLGSAS